MNKNVSASCHHSTNYEEGSMYSVIYINFSWKVMITYTQKIIYFV